MIRQVARRLTLAAFTLILATALLYVAIRMVPGTPWGNDPSTPTARIQEWVARNHLDDGFALGYLRWLGEIARGEMGHSFAVARGEPVGRLIAQRLPVSLTLGILGLGSAWVVALLSSLASARRPGGLWDRAWSFALYGLYAAPTFWVAMMLQELFANRLGWLPPFGAGPAGGGSAVGISSLFIKASYWVLPPLCLALGSLTFLFRFSRTSLLEGVRSTHVRAGRARGLPEPILVRRHAFAATRLNLITLVGLMAPSVVGGSIIIERIFSLPGLGGLFFLAVGNRDYPVVMGVGLVLVVTAVIAGAMADALYLVLEPRLRSRSTGRP
jgi:peptide/nickel transport system permease protein